MSRGLKPFFRKMMPRPRRGGDKNSGSFLQVEIKKENKISVFLSVFFSFVFKAVKSLLILFNILLFVLAITVIHSYVSAEKWLEHRYADTDKDGIINMNDPDVDGDGIPNITDTDPNGNGIHVREDVLKAARTLIGRPYDQFNAGCGDILWKFGAIVCIDVVNLSFERAGIYFEKELRDHYKKSPKSYVSRSWNNPSDKNFARRVRNFRAFCTAKGYILPDGAALKPADIVMFGNSHAALIEKVNEDGS